MPTRRSARSVSRIEVQLERPYRLDLTASALRRVATNVVDVYTADGEYLRAFELAGSVATLRARQVDANRLAISIDAESGEHAAVESLARRLLGVDRDVGHFHRAARAIPWLAPLVRRMPGLRPPRYPSLWETFVNTISFQQVSLHAASAITRRMILAIGDRVEAEGRPLFIFPAAGRFQRASDEALRKFGFSASKVRTLRFAADAIGTGAISEKGLEGMSSGDAARELQALPGIGPWTAAVILLRGLGRLDVFPPGDSGVAANLTVLTGSPIGSISRILEELGSQQGMLYFQLLLARLEREGRIGEPSIGVDAQDSSGHASG